MARGFESKSVESQQAEERVQSRERVSPEEIERNRKREGIEMSRRRVLNELQSARSDVHRAALKNALAHLDDELARIG